MLTPQKRLAPRGSAFIGALAACTIAIALYALITSGSDTSFSTGAPALENTSSSQPSTATKSSAFKPLPPSVAMALVNITPETLAAAGVQQSQVPAATQAVREFMASKQVALLQSVIDARQAQDDVRTRAQEFHAHKVANDSQLRQAKARAKAASINRDKLMQELRAAATTGLDEAQVRTLDTINRNKNRSDLPSAYLTVERTPQELTQLTDAYCASKVDARAKLTGTTLPSTQTDAPLQEDAEVMQAKMRVESSRALIEQALSQADGVTASATTK